MTTTTKKTTTDSLFGSNKWRPRSIGAAIALALLVTACSSDEEPAATTAPVLVTTTAVTTSVVEEKTPVASIGPSDLLANALQQYSNGYQFRATTTVNDQEASVQTGRWLNGASQITVQFGGGEVEYIITADGQWVRLPGGEWEEIDGALPVSYPLEPLAKPESLGPVSVTGSTARVRATYAASAFGLSGDQVDVLLDFDAGALVGVSFAHSVDGIVTESTTSLGLLAEATPITAPPN
jgi:hypothetical protein